MLHGCHDKHLVSAYGLHTELEIVGVWCTFLFTQIWFPCSRKHPQLRLLSAHVYPADIHRRGHRREHAQCLATAAHRSVVPRRASCGLLLVTRAFLCISISSKKLVVAKGITTTNKGIIAPQGDEVSMGKVNSIWVDVHSGKRLNNGL